MKACKLPVLLLCGSALIALAGCQTTSAPSQTDLRTSKIDSVLERAASSAAARGESGESLMILEKMYKRNSSDPQTALRYAQALRQAGYVNQASLVLGPFANDPSSPAAAKTEYAAAQLEMGRYKDAEEYAQQAVRQDPTDAQAYHYLGIALDAQGMHKEAERAFRLGLDHWSGDPSPIMNNLALNLASQGFIGEAIEILEKAKSISPDRVEIERNLRIVTALEQSGVQRAPKPGKKPADKASAVTVKETAPASDEETKASYGPHMND